MLKLRPQTTQFNNEGFAVPCVSLCVWVIGQSLVGLAKG